MIEDMLRRALAAMERGESFALLTVIESTGSSPGKPGHKMIVYPDGRHEGTVGGGALEHRARENALTMLARGRGGVVRFDLNPESPESPESIGAICGGEATLAIEVIRPRAHVLLCGGGHVAHALARQCEALGFAYTVVDAREEMVTRDRYPGGAAVVLAGPPRHVEDRGLAPYSHIVILTHNHELDRETLRAVASAGFSGYVGMIGSRRKWMEVRRDLLAAGIAPDWLDGVHCPVGLEIGARSPEEIAVSIIAQLIQEIHARGGEA